MITAGSILIDKGTLLPEPMRLEREPQESGWARIVNTPDRRQIEKELSAAGWTFFYMAGVIKTIAFGFHKSKTVRAAIDRLIQNVRRQECNCLEIDQVATHSFLGMQYVSVSAHSRHIQKGVVFSGTLMPPLLANPT